MTPSDDKLPSAKATGDVDGFLRKLAETPKVHTPGQRGRLIFALDATASRQPAWDRASQLQGEMFTTAASLGGLEVQLCWYQGFGEFYATPWVLDSKKLLRMMTTVTCLAGETQLRKVLKHALKETGKRRVNAVVFIGDACEEDIDQIGKLAGNMGLLGLPAFMFHEGDNPLSTFAFQQVAKLSGGAFCRFDQSSAQVLRDLLNAVAVFAAGGVKALEDLGRRQGGEVLRIAHQVRGG